MRRLKKKLLMDSNNDKSILITGASGMLGSYIRKAFEKENVSEDTRKYSILTLGRAAGNDFTVDLTVTTPDFQGTCFDTVIHCAGTESDKDAFPLNTEGTRRLLDALDCNPPQNFVYVSSYKVYGDEGIKLRENSPLSGEGAAARSKIEAERIVREWGAGHDVNLTIIRPARMFGNGVGGETLRLFNDALDGSYIHIRGNDARISMVTALDVAGGIKAIYPDGGTYNAADGRDPRFLDMMEAMTENVGKGKRMFTLPASWAGWLWRVFRWIPSINRNLNPATAASRMKTLTIDGSLLSEKTGNGYFDTIRVIAHDDTSYPYSEK